MVYIWSSYVRRRPKILLSTLQAARPKQWIKNLLVAGAPIAAGQIKDEIIPVILGVLGFTFISIAGYVLNDWLDRDFDRLHQSKKNRPFASGKLNFINMISIILICFSGAFLCTYFLPPQYLITLCTYLFLTVSYSTIIKHKPVVEMIWLSSSFLIRAVAGSAIIETTPTSWFIICVFFGALFIVSAKRSAEMKTLESLQTRKVMALYSKNFINTVFSTSLAVCLITYALWAFETHSESIIAQVSILPFACSLYLYAYQCDFENAQHPEDLFFKSRAFLMSVLLTILCLFMVFYL